MSGLRLMSSIWVTQTESRFLVSFHVYHLNGRRVSFFLFQSSWWLGLVCRINVGGEVDGWLVGGWSRFLGFGPAAWFLFSTYFQNFRNSWQFETFRNFSKLFEIFRNLSKFMAIRNLSKFFEFFRNPWRFEIFRNFSKLFEIFRNFSKFFEINRNFSKFLT